MKAQDSEFNGVGSFSINYSLLKRCCGVVVLMDWGCRNLACEDPKLFQVLKRHVPAVRLGSFCFRIKKEKFSDYSLMNA